MGLLLLLDDIGGRLPWGGTLPEPARETFLVDWEAGPLTPLADLDWTDVSEFTLACQVRRGRRLDLDRFEAGSGRVVLENVDRRFEPGHEGGAYYPNVLPLRRFRWLTGENAISNPRAADDAAGWSIGWRDGSGSGETIARTTTESPFPDPYRTGFVCAGASTGGHLAVMPTSAAANVRACDPGDILNLSCYYRADDELALHVKLGARTFGGGGAASIPTDQFDLAAAGVTVGQWVRIGTTYTVPSGVADVGVEVSSNADGGSGDCGFAVTGFQIVARADGRDGMQPYVDEPLVNFTGMVSDFPIVWDGGDYSRVECSLVDAFDTLAGADLVETLPAVPASGTRVEDILDAIGWPAADRDIAAGAVGIQAEPLESSSGLKGLAHLFDVAEAELGAFFVGRDGTITLHDRNTRRTSPDPKAVYSDDAVNGTSYPAARISPSFGRERIINEAHITRRGGITQTVKNTASRDDYGPRSHTRTLLLDSDNAAMAIARGLVLRRADPLFSFRRVDLEPWLHTPGIMLAALNHEISDLVTVEANPPDTGAPSTVRSLDCWVEAIEHSLDGGGHTMAIDLSPAYAADFTYWRVGQNPLGSGPNGTRIAF